MLQSQDCHTEQAHYEYEGAEAPVHVSPSHVVGLFAGRWFLLRWTELAAVVAEEAPGEESGDGVADRPPDGEQRHEPGLL